uniref:Protein IWS1 homolog n=1 Tax=Gouania willdenowi TaxID=441366 RepID=A0A8C5D9X0_GOUWI
MDGEKNFISGGRSDDDGGTPVQDEHPASDSAGRQSEDQRVCVSAAKRKKFLSDSEDEEEDEEKPVVKKSRVMSDDDNDSNGSNSKSGYEDEQLIADIFGASEDEDEEDFMGFDKEHLEGDKQTKEKTAPQEEESDSGKGVDHSGQHFISDFDIMLARRKAMKSRRRVGGISISDADDVVSAMIAKMTEAAEEDRTLNIQNKLATKKLLLLPQVVKHLKKQDLKETFLDCGVMSAIKEWISPLPDKSLPILNIREEMLKILQQLTSVSQQTLKHSSIGRAVMFLYKHPKETRSNKELALKLIHEWSRPIFGVTSNIRELTREERQQRDLDQHMPQRRCLRYDHNHIQHVGSQRDIQPVTSRGQHTLLILSIISSFIIVLMFSVLPVSFPVPPLTSCVRLNIPSYLLSYPLFLNLMDVCVSVQLWWSDSSQRF